MKRRLDKARWRTASPLLDELLSLDAIARAERLAELQRKDVALADDLTYLLEQYEVVEREHFLEGAVLTPVSDRLLEGQAVGSYTLDRLLGQGGMGAVWLAHRSDGRYEAHVAIKLLNSALLGPGGTERFRREGQALGRLTHPNIARLVDAGVTQMGQPYLVIEYVEGETIKHWCDSRGLETNAIVRLFMDVLAAVAHAHAKLILHRDLKPSNILVTAEGQVKLVDFGIAKLLDDDVDAARRSELTQVAGHAFTPDYAAPEQIQGGEVSSATDVYALGVLLYVLLTGQHPTAGGEHASFDRLRAIVDTDPVRPSEAGLSSAATPGAGPERQRQRVRSLQGDLDNIVLKALRKSPAERYPTVAAFAEDLRRCLNHEPVSARPDSFAYRSTKFVARNKLSVIAGSIVLVTIIVAAGISVRQAIEATRQRDRALMLASRNEAVLDFVTSMLTEVAPAEQPVRVADLLQRSQSMLIQQNTLPDHQAAILGLLSGYYLSSGKPARADVLLSRSLELTQVTQDRELRSTLLCDTAYAASLLGRLADARKLIEQGISLSSSYPMAAVRCLRSRAYMAQNTNDPQTALEYAQRAQRRLKELPVPKPDVEAELLADIAAAHYLAGRSGEAERFYAQAMEQLTRIGLGESPAVFFLRNNWGLASLSSGDNRRALDQFDEALRIAVERSIDGEPPPYLLVNRASTLSSLARYPEALKAFDVAIESATRAGNTNIRVGGLVYRANTYFLMGDVRRAALELAEIAPQIGNTIAPDSVPAMSILQVQARVDAAQGRLRESLAGLTKIIQFFDDRSMAVAALVRALSARCELYVLQGNTSAAMVDAQRALDISRRLQSDKPYSSLTGLSLLLMATVHQSSGGHSTAQVLAGKAVPHLTETLGPDHPDTRRAEKLRGS